MNDRQKSFWVGLFIIVALALTICFLLFLRPYVGNGDTRLRIRFTNVDRIRRNTYVTFAGKPVGRIVDIVEVENPREAAADRSGNLYVYELHADVDSKVEIYNTDEISYATSGLLGEKVVSIRPKKPLSGEKPIEVTHDVLYAISEDKMSELMNRLGSLSQSMERTLGKVDGFIDKSGGEMGELLRHFNEVDLPLRLANTTDKLIEALSTFEILSNKIASGEGTLARLVNSDSLYVQLMTTLNRASVLMQDIDDYGILFQFNSKWQRDKKLRSY